MCCKWNINPFVNSIIINGIYRWIQSDYICCKCINCYCNNTTIHRIIVSIPIFRGFNIKNIWIYYACFWVPQNTICNVLTRKCKYACRFSTINHKCVTQIIVTSLIRLTKPLKYQGCLVYRINTNIKCLF